MPMIAVSVRPGVNDGEYRRSADGAPASGGECPNPTIQECQSSYDPTGFEMVVFDR